MKPCTFWPQPLKFFPKKNFLYFFLKKPLGKNFLYFPKRRLFLYFRKWNPALFSLSSRNKKSPLQKNKNNYALRNGRPQKTSYI